MSYEWKPDINLVDTYESTMMKSNGLLYYGRIASMLLCLAGVHDVSKWLDIRALADASRYEAA